MNKLEDGKTSEKLTIQSDYDILHYPNGGYLAYLASEHMSEKTEHVDLLSLTAHFLGHPESGVADAELSIIDLKKSMSRASLMLKQGGQNLAFYTAAFSNFDKSTGATDTFGTKVPDMIAYEDCIRTQDIPLLQPLGGFLENFDMRLDPNVFKAPKPGQPAVVEGWVSMADESKVTTTTLALFADAFPPPIFNAISTNQWGSIPTIDYSVHVKARPADGPIHAVFSANSLVRGYLEIDGELRDIEGNLVAVSRQLAKFRGQVI